MEGDGPGIGDKIFGYSKWVRLPTHMAPSMNHKISRAFAKDLHPLELSWQSHAVADVFRFRAESTQISLINSKAEQWDFLIRGQSG